MENLEVMIVLIFLLPLILAIPIGIRSDGSKVRVCDLSYVFVKKLILQVLLKKE